MVGEMNSAVSLVDFDRMLVDTSAAGGSVAVSRLTSEWFYSTLILIFIATASGLSATRCAEP